MKTEKEHDIPARMEGEGAEGADDRGDALLDGIEALFANHERAALASQPFDPNAYTNAYRRVGIIGGGSAGYITALALRKHLPQLEVTVVESDTVPIIGVGEATVTDMLPFLHGYLGLDVHDFYARVWPTWKLGIHFEWGLPGDYSFEAPFDWGVNGVGVLGSLRYRGDITAMTTQSWLMSRDVSPIFRTGEDSVFSLLPHLPFGYHLDNQRFVAYLTDEARKAGTGHITADIVHVAVAGDGETVTHLVTRDGQRLEFDLYIDCSGFRSLILEGALKTPFRSYGDSLFTDTAVTFNHPHGGTIKPYTRARTMDSGWCWTIPQVEDDHSGYVFSSDFCSIDQAVEEIHRRFDGAGEPRVVRFRSGRHEASWRGNVVAIGNAYAFVEPLESTGLLMICTAARSLVACFPRSKEHRSTRELFNLQVAQSWDSLRWFLSIHYKFNRRLSTEFWKAAREQTDISGLQLAVEIYREFGPLTFQDLRMREMLASSSRVPFFGLAGFDCIMLGQQVATRQIPPPEPQEVWRDRHARAETLAERALTVSEALDLVRDHPALLDEMLHDPDSWIKEASQFLKAPGLGCSTDPGDRAAAPT